MGGGALEPRTSRVSSFSALDHQNETPQLKQPSYRVWTITGNHQDRHAHAGLGIISWGCMPMKLAFMRPNSRLPCWNTRVPAPKTSNLRPATLSIGPAWHHFGGYLWRFGHLLPLAGEQLSASPSFVAAWDHPDTKLRQGSLHCTPEHCLVNVYFGGRSHASNEQNVSFKEPCEMMHVFAGR